MIVWAIIQSEVYLSANTRKAAPVHIIRMYYLYCSSICSLFTLAPIRIICSYTSMHILLALYYILGLYMPVCIVRILVPYSLYYSASIVLLSLAYIFYTIGTDYIRLPSAPVN